MRLWSRAFRFVLLVSVVLNLGDAPYLDEIFGDAVQHHQGPSVSDPGAADPTVPNPQDPSERACCGYQLLLSLQGIAAEPLALPVPITKRDFTPQDFQFYASAYHDRIYRPPFSDSLLA